MDEQQLERRAEIARRLKAGRWLAGSVRENARGKTGYRVAEMSTEDLAQRGELQENGITATLLGSIERMERHTPPMELRAIEDALGLPNGWFDIEPSSILPAPHHGSRSLSDEEISRAAELLGPLLLEAARARRQAGEPGRRDAGGQGR